MQCNELAEAIQVLQRGSLLLVTLMLCADRSDKFCKQLVSLHFIYSHLTLILF